MSSAVDPRLTLPSYVSVKCRCGRSLRARPEQFGGEVRCWDCKNAVAVPMPKMGIRLRYGFVKSFQDIFLLRPSLFLIGLALLLTACMALPLTGPGVVFGMIALLGAGYGDIVRRVSASESIAPALGGSRTKKAFVVLWRSFLCVCLSAWIVIPIWWQPWMKGDLPRFEPAYLAAAVFGWMVLPTMVLASFGQDRMGVLGIGRTVRLVIRHPFASLATLLLIPLGLILIEAILVGMLSYQGIFSTVLLDHFAMPGSPQVIMNIPFYDNIEYRHVPGADYYKHYASLLRQGYTLLSAIPASLNTGTLNQLNTEATIEYTATVYLVIREAYTFLINLIILAILAVQARWLGLLSAVEYRHSLD